jgi:hypothetical protein
MCRECYELELPGKAWSQTLKENPEITVLAGIAVAAPAALALLSYSLIR